MEDRGKGSRVDSKERGREESLNEERERVLKGKEDRESVPENKKGKFKKGCVRRQEEREE